MFACVPLLAFTPGDSTPWFFFFQVWIPRANTRVSLHVMFKLINSKKGSLWAVRTEVEVKTFTRITVDPYQMGGLPCIRRLRITVATVVGMVSEGMAEGEILNAYPDLEVEDVREALRYAAEAVRERELPVAGGS